MKKKGFTLIELLVVIAIIALLLSIVLPGLQRAKEYAKRMVCAAQLKGTGTAMAVYSDEFNGFLPPDHDKAGYVYTVYYDSFRNPSSGKPIPLRWANLYELDYIETPEVFYCPSNRKGSFLYESYTDPSPWGTLPQQYNTSVSGTQCVRIGYTYYPIDRKADSPSDALADKYIDLNPNLPYATDVLHHRKWLSHQRSSGFDDSTYRESNKYSVNALYPDGHVSNCNDPDFFKGAIWDATTFDSNFYYPLFRALGNR